MKRFTTEVNNCARCGGDHLQVEFQPFAAPPDDTTHWGTCQKTGDPILMVVRQVEVLEPAGSLASVRAILDSPHLTWAERVAQARKAVGLDEVPPQGSDTPAH
ncbi:MAG: hypothetical protein ACRYFV_13720 [Janthinobacterium lividum]